MDNPEMNSWWESLGRDERILILVEWPRTGGLPIEALTLVPERRRGDKEEPNAWVWRIPGSAIRGEAEGDDVEGDEVDYDRVGCAEEFSDFIRRQVERPFQLEAGGA